MKITKNRDFSVIEIGPIKLVLFSASSGLAPVLLIGKRTIILNQIRRASRALGRLSWAIRGCFPTFWSVGLRSCDEPHYGRVWCFRKAVVWNHWHLRRIERDWDASSDGPASYGRISLMEYLRSPEWQEA